MTGDADGSVKMGLRLIWVDFEVDVLLAPDGQASEPVFFVEDVAGSGPVGFRKDASGGGKIGAGDFAADGAGRDAHVGIVAQALIFARVTAGHEVELAVVLSKPDGRWDRNAGFAEGGERNVFLSGDGGRDGHGFYFTA